MAHNGHTALYKADTIYSLRVLRKDIVQAGVGYIVYEDSGT